MRAILWGMTLLVFVCVTIPGIVSSVWAQGQNFAVLGKSSDDPNFIDVAAACALVALKQGDSCELLHCPGSANPRLQVYALQKALRSKRYDAIAISVTMSQPLAALLTEHQDMPIVTFDSPFDEASSHLSLAYVGPENMSFGRDLAKIAKKIKPNGGRIIIMAADHDPNLQERVMGVRKELSGDDTLSGNTPLQGENGWIESIRSPWDTGDSIQRTMDQLSFSFKELDVDVVLSVGHWPIVQPDVFRATVKPFQYKLKQQKVLMIAGVGNVSPKVQSLMDDNLVTGVVSINFPMIGQQLYQVMSAVVAGRSVQSETVIPNKTLFGR